MSLLRELRARRAVQSAQPMPGQPVVMYTEYDGAGFSGGRRIIGGSGTLTLAIGNTATVKVDHRDEATFSDPEAPVFTLPEGVSYVVNAPPTVIGAFKPE